MQPSTLAGYRLEGSQPKSGLFGLPGSLLRADPHGVSVPING